MNAAKTAATLKGLLELETGDSITIASLGQRALLSKENERYDIILHITRCKDEKTNEAAKEKPAGKHPAGIIIP